MRSLLFVPGDEPAKMRKALACGADAVILDLEDSVAQANKPHARKEVAAFLEETKGSDVPVIVRINPLTQTHGAADDDLEAIMMQAVSIIMLPKAQGGADVQWLGAKLSTHEAMSGKTVGDTRIIAITPETPAAVFTLGSYAQSSPRLVAMTWGGGEDLSSATGAKTNRGTDGFHTEPYKMVRHLSLFAAAAAEVMAIDGVYTNFRDCDGARSEAELAARDGFTGKLAIHPSQVDIFNDVFRPNPQELEKSQAIIDAFSKAGNAGVINFNGVMLDKPHLARARRVLEISKR